MTGIKRKQFKQTMVDASSSHQIGSKELFRASRREFRILAVNQGLKVAMEARTRQQEFSWTTCRAMLGKKWSQSQCPERLLQLLLVVTRNELIPRQQNQRSEVCHSAHEPKVLSLQRWKYLFCFLEVPSGTLL